MSDSSDLRPSARIDLARSPAFTLGAVEVRPSLRQLLRRSDGAEEVVEPRIMQVLVALAAARGGIVTRDELLERCWEGRVVGDDALNRAISRVRRLADGIGRDAFRLETVTKVGYRLVPLGDAARPAEEPAPATPPLASAPSSGGPPMGRRGWIAGAFALTGVGAAAFFLLDRSPEQAAGPRSPIARALFDQAHQALSQTTREGQNQAFGLYRRALAIEPDYADGWAMLGCAYAFVASYQSSAEGAASRVRAAQAARRALALDPDNARGRAIMGLLEPVLGGWLARERHLRPTLARSPDDPHLLLILAYTMSHVGRNREALRLHERLFRSYPAPLPGRYFGLIVARWAAGRLEEADRLIAEAVELFPTHFAIWFARFYIQIYSGRAGEAIALGENRDRRPTGIASPQFEALLRVARAMRSGDAGATDAVIAEQRDWARRGAGYAENAIQFASALGRLDEAFVIADAYYFGRNFTVPEIRFTPEQGTFTPRRERLTAFLFNPATAAMRADDRFVRLTEEVGLTRYWARSGSQPDYLRYA